MSEEGSTRSSREGSEEYYLRRLEYIHKDCGIQPDKEDTNNTLTKQVGGNHYKDCGIQPVEYIHANSLDYFEGNVVKYITRHRTKGEGEKDIKKAIHYAELILELYYNK
jgi:hypothetical protein